MDSKKINTKRILIPLLYDYYMFDYFKALAIQLLNDGFNVVILSMDKKVLAEYSRIDERLTIIKAPRVMRALLNRSGNIFFRTILWLFGWVWGFILKGRYDFSIVPWDNKPLWYIMTRYFPSMSCHNSTEYLDMELTLEHMYLTEKYKNKLSHRFWLFLDKIFSGRLLPKINEEVLQYNGYIIIDRLMGFRSLNYLHGFSRLDYLAVTGERIKRNLHNSGLGNNGQSPKIVVTGSPSYEGIMNIKKNFNEEQRQEIYSKYGFDYDKNIYSFFLSPSSFTMIQINEVIQVISLIRESDKNSVFILKFHPKTRKCDPVKFREKLLTLSGDLVIITEFGGDELNARIILSAKCVLQKQGTVGFIAMLFNMPLISYDLVDTDYYDNMYELIGGSFHCKTKAEILSALKRISTPKGMSELEKIQLEACKELCYPMLSPCSEISKIIKHHYSL